MEFMLDTVNLAEIKKWAQILPLAGVTSNPTIIKREGELDFFEHLKKVRELIGPQPSLHVQVVAKDTAGMVAEAKKLQAELGGNLYIKIPVTQEGLVAIKQLKQADFKVTATAIYTTMQGLLALEAGADYLAPYYNRMENLDTDPVALIAQLASAREKSTQKGKILAASFKNASQVTKALGAGAQAVTAGSDIYAASLADPAIAKAVSDFAIDWKTSQKRAGI
ncbi:MULTISPECIES: fructose-6-phosphate aldolase [Ligilactobacillus]|uniref:Fructose-6-phosphate aldolase n=1 Tax=Ligilactobacillus animalis TaxID=1605 RepID=A0AAJ6FM77_9LACO|nr:fructose-6-phosphate aldolase [Ligilactobacillus animalis]KDA45601.1 fructose-6-phosphate aldolase, fsa [Ligilactobacillus animalis]KRM59743.1 fructose-6-phosphate aldolase [Ligilactobacillus animalis KCTC 3501 = DSM 20602]MDO5883032.1 fructose-6-phosphate aldolase [Ligilactobacillus animalis]MDQ2234388.1 fructose-6-phosphate aldolase [Ligilactobacillus animalis]MDU1486727.1 fructose-6-phosphate aldolase [Ligilactobacillus animalis]